ncbi:MAG: response regulator transcription factor [Xanthomonadaceae bacterium]|jgi:DNA-binding NarL/FixJ family response regulator|nr:response regulator transcription factor [Xanthomonadaceae bacterium]
MAAPTLLVADDHPLFRDALKRLVAGFWPGARVLEAADAEGVLALAEAQPQADLLLLDLTMPGARGFGVLVHLRAQHPALPVVMVSARDDADTRRRALEHGAVGFLSKSASPAEMQRTLDAVLAGEAPEPPPAARPVDADERAIAARVASLTPAQFRVLSRVAAGLLNKQIAWELGIGEATVKAHMGAVLDKLGASNRTQAVLMLGRLGLEPAAPIPDEA